MVVSYEIYETRRRFVSSMSYEMTTSVTDPLFLPFPVFVVLMDSPTPTPVHSLVLRVFVCLQLLLVPVTVPYRIVFNGGSSLHDHLPGKSSNFDTACHIFGKTKVINVITINRAPSWRVDCRRRRQCYCFYNLRCTHNYQISWTCSFQRELLTILLFYFCLSK